MAIGEHVAEVHLAVGALKGQVEVVHEAGLVLRGVGATGLVGPCQRNINTVGRVEVK